MPWGYHLGDLEPAGDPSFTVAEMKKGNKKKGRIQRANFSVSVVPPLLNSAPKF